MAVVDDVVALLAQNQIGFAMIGAAAVAAHGVPRSTRDLDLLTTDSRVLNAEVWTTIAP